MQLTKRLGVATAKRALGWKVWTSGIVACTS